MRRLSFRPERGSKTMPSFLRQQCGCAVSGAATGKGWFENAATLAGTAAQSRVLRLCQ